MSLWKGKKSNSTKCVFQTKYFNPNKGLLQVSAAMSRTPIITLLSNNESLTKRTIWLAESSWGMVVSLYCLHLLVFPMYFELKVSHCLLTREETPPLGPRQEENAILKWKDSKSLVSITESDLVTLTIYFIA